MKNEISALMDGELDAEDAAGMIAQLRKTDELSDTWAVYHLISDTLGQSEAQTSRYLAACQRKVGHGTDRACTSPVDKTQKQGICSCGLDNGSSRDRVDECADHGSATGKSGR